MNKDEHGSGSLSLHNITACLCSSVVAVVLSGCANPLSDQYYMELEVPESRVRTIEKFDPAAQSTDAVPAAPAPASLDLTIEEIRALAIENNLDIEVALMDPTIARQDIDEERARFEALFFGSVNFVKTDTPTASLLSGSQAEALQSQAGVSLPLTTGGTITASTPLNRTETDLSFATLNPSYEADVNFSISQPLLRGAGPRANTHFIRVARYSTKSTEARTKLQIMRIIADIDRLYWRLYAARRELEVRKQQYDLAERQLERAQRQVAVGNVAEIEITRAESGAAERLEAIIIAEQAVRERQRELKRAINKPDLPIDSVTTLVPTTAPNPLQYNFNGPELANEALGKRMEMLELELQLVIDASTIDYLRNQALPLLTLDYTYGINGLGASFGDAYDLVADKNFEDHILSARMEVPLGNLAAKARIRRAAFSRLQRVATRAQQELMIREEVLNAADAIDTNWQRIMAAQRRTILATRTFEAEQRQFDQGQRTSTDVLEAQSDLADAQLAEVRAVSDYEISQIDLAVATGTLLGASQVHWEPLEPKVNDRAW